MKAKHFSFKGTYDAKHEHILTTQNIDNSVKNLLLIPCGLMLHMIGWY